MEGLQGYKTDFAGRDGFVWWVGEVEDNKDPSQLGRVKVRIVGWYTGNKSNKGADSYTKTLPTENLPWATVLLPTDKPQIKGTGTTTELQVGAFVMGFFLDGDEAQLPVVMGAFRGFKQADDQKSAAGKGKGAQETTKATTIADITVAKENETNTPQQATMAGEKNHGGAPLAKDQQQAVAGPAGQVEEARGGGLSTAEACTPGNAVTNPLKPPTESQEVADGANGPAGEGFEKGLTRMLTELGTMAASIASGSDGQFISLITGKRINGDKVLEHLGKLANYISSGISAILAPLKEFLAEITVKIINTIVKIISSFIPLSIFLGILDLISFILDLFCVPHPQWLSIVQSALTDITGFADQIVGMVVSQISNVVSTIVSKVQGITDRILSNINQTIQKVRDIAKVVVSAVNALKSGVEFIGQAKSVLDMLFKVDFTKLNWGSLIAILKALLGLLFQKDCGRKIKKPKTKQWFPLLGSTTCDDVSEFVTGMSGFGSTSLPTSLKEWTDTTSSAGYVDNLFKGINIRVMEVQSFLDGSRVIHNATKGKEWAATQGPGGVSNFQDNQGNQHTSVPNNETKIIARDKCTTVKANRIDTIEGDYYLKVHGNWHIEVEGAINNSQGNGPQASASGSSKPTAKVGDSGASTSGGTTTTTTVQTSSGATNLQRRNNTAFLSKDLQTDVVSKNTISFGEMITLRDRVESLEERLRREDEEFYSNLKPINPPSGVGVVTPPMKYTNLATSVDDDNEQKSAERKSGDHNIAYSGDVRIQGNQVSINAISNLKLNGNQIKIEGNNIGITADGEITQEANWITSFLNCGRFEFVALFNPLAAISGQFNIVKGAIIDLTTDLPFPGATPPAHVRMSVAQNMPTTMADIITGSQPAIHFTFVASPTGGIGEIVASSNGAIVNQVTTGLASYGVGTGFMATGCAVGPHQVYGLPLLLN